MTAEATYVSGVVQQTWTTNYQGDRYDVRPPSTGTSQFGTRYTFDGHGNLKGVAEFKNSSGSSVATTTYTYTARDELATITDPAGNVTTQTYDWLGRRTQLVDRDQGTWASTYDGNGNVLCTEDGLSQIVCNVWDKLDRLKEQRLNSATGTPLVSRTYDTAAKGLPYEVIRHHGSSQYTVRFTGYDNRGRLTGKSIIIPAAEGSLAGTYNFSYAYDGADHLTSVGYPAAGGLSAETLVTAYTTLGYPTTLTGLVGYVSATTFDDLGRLSGTNQGSGSNATIRTFTYDNQQRLKTFRTTVAGVDRQNEELTYDTAGNVTRLRDIMSGQRQCFSYDGRARLLHAWTTNVDCTDESAPNETFGPNPYNVRYTYNDIGNILSLQDLILPGDPTLTYTYPASGATSVRPHAVSSVGGTMLLSGFEGARSVGTARPIGRGGAARVSAR